MSEKLGFNATWSMAVGGMVGGGITAAGLAVRLATGQPITLGAFAALVFVAIVIRPALLSCVESE